MVTAPPSPDVDPSPGQQASAAQRDYSEECDSTWADTVTTSTQKMLFAPYAHRVLKQVHPDKGITDEALQVVEDFTLDTLAKVGASASALREGGRQRCECPGGLSPRDVQTAVRLVFPGELAKHAVSEGTKAVRR
ncbi:hypothetical protein EMIHUDRAFT_71444, partial [Emiliania huxleyi CCMP1516]|uniref:Histone H2A/H2B/H3 domain-containing protein n=2 Tax=Emiliania huxleyi TaxID=2903 RepID=A0A0D3KEE3_EMIH1